MARDKHTNPPEDATTADPRITAQVRRLDPSHSSSDCHQAVARLRAQADCLEEVLADIRGEIDALESEEIIDRVRERLYDETDT